MSEMREPFTVIPMKEYHQREEMSGSDLGLLKRSGLELYRTRKDNPDKPSREMLLGSAVHAYMEEKITGEEPDTEVLEIGVASRNTKTYRAAAEENPEAIILVGDELDLVRGASASLFEAWEEWLEDEYLSMPGVEIETLVEPSLVVEDMRARPDLFLFVGQAGELRETVHVNWKTAGKLDPKKMIWKFEGEYGYDVSTGHYMLAYEAAGLDLSSMRFIFPFVVMEDPFPVYFVEITDDFFKLSNWKDEAEALHAQLREANKSGVWKTPLGERRILL